MNQEILTYMLVPVVLVAGGYFLWQRYFGKVSRNSRHGKMIASGNINNSSEEEIIRMVTAIFQGKGYRVQKISPELQDFADFQLEKEGLPAFVSTKCWNTPKVGVSQFSQVVIGLNQQNSEHNYIITAGVFDKETSEMAKYSRNLVLIDGNKLKSLIATANIS